MTPVAAWRSKGPSGIPNSPIPFGIPDGTGDDFQYYVEAIPAPSGSLNAYAGWSGAWYTGNNYLGVQSVDDFQNAPLGTPTNLNTGTGWGGVWYTGDVYTGLKSIDDHQSYQPGAIY